MDLLVGKLTRLPLETQDALRQLACLGNVADVSMLSIVLGRPRNRCTRLCGRPSRQQLIDRLERSYKFVHDRVQEAAYALIPESSRAEAHLTDRPAARSAHATRKTRRSDLRNRQPAQPRRAADHVTGRTRAARRAQPDRRQARQASYGLCLRTHISYRRCSAVGGRCVGAPAGPDLRFGAGPGRMRVPDRRAAGRRGAPGCACNARRQYGRTSGVACRRMDVYTMLGQSDRAVAVALDYFRQVGIEWSPHPTEDEARREYEQHLVAAWRSRDRGSC